MAIIPIGDGQLIELEEGALRVPPPEPPAKPKPRSERVSRVTKRKVVRSKTYTVTKNGVTYLRKQRPEGYVKPNYNPNPKNDHLDIPGFLEWQQLRSRRIANLGKAGGRPLGRADGLTQSQCDAAWADARVKARKDMTNIKSKIDLPEAAEEALMATLVVMRSPMTQQVKLAAAKQVLDFTMAKPVAKSEVTVNAAEKWLESLGKDE